MRVAITKLPQLEKALSTSVFDLVLRPECLIQIWPPISLKLMFSFGVFSSNNTFNLQCALWTLTTYFLQHSCELNKQMPRNWRPHSEHSRMWQFSVKSGCSKRWWLWNIVAVESKFVFTQARGWSTAWLNFFENPWKFNFCRQPFSWETCCSI